MDSFFTDLDDRYYIQIRPELLSVDEFATIWNRDKVKNKETARKELTYIWSLLCRDRKKNPYYEYADTDERIRIVTEDIFGHKTKWRPDEAVKLAVQKYKERCPRSIYEEEKEATYKDIVKLRNFMSDLDLNATDDNGRLMFDPKKYQEMLKQRGEMLKRYRDLDKLVEETKDDERIKGGRERGIFDDPDNNTT